MDRQPTFLTEKVIYTLKSAWKKCVIKLCKSLQNYILNKNTHQSMIHYKEKNDNLLHNVASNIFYNKQAS